jgi:hypothetical protein
MHPQTEPLWITPSNGYDGTFLSAYQSVIDKYVPSYRYKEPQTTLTLTSMLPRVALE